MRPSATRSPAGGAADAMPSPDPISRPSPEPAPEAITIDVLVEADGWSAVPDAEQVAVRAATAALAAAGDDVPLPCEMSITLADDAAIRILNRDWRDKDKATNVLSFPAQELPEDVVKDLAEEGVAQPLGDIIVALETLTTEATAEGKRPGDHLAHLVVHGVLHLLGYDHIDDTEAEEMEAFERDILAGLGIDDPYGLPQD